MKKKPLKKSEDGNEQKEKSLIFLSFISIHKNQYREFRAEKRERIIIMAVLVHYSILARFFFISHRQQRM